MSEDIVNVLSLALRTLVLVSCFYTLFAWLQVRRLRPGAQPPSDGPAPAVTILKPLDSAEPGLYENLASFCRQNYAGAVQIVCGVHSGHDPAAAVVGRLIADMPRSDLKLVVTAASSGPSNDKVANLIGMSVHAVHDVIVVSDSDIGVAPDYLARTVAALRQPGVGVVTWLYRGVPFGGVPARLARMAIDYHFLPSVLVGRALRLAHPCFGSTMAMTRETLKRIGGFEAFGEHLADDYAIGDAVRRLGLTIAVPDGVVSHACTETSLRALVDHELRWARTVRAVDPGGFAGSVLTHPVPLALLAALAAGFTAPAWGVVALALVSRLVLQRQVDHTLGTQRDTLWLALARDVLSFVLFIGSFFVTVVRWRGRAYQVRRDGTLVPVRQMPVRDTRA